MNDSFLVVDVSNSFTKYARATRKRVGAVSRHPTPQLTLAWARALARRYPAAPLFLSSVVPRKTALFVRAFGKRLHRLHGADEIGIPVHFRNRAQVGADRLANAIAARYLYGAPAIVIDFGTAVTFDVIDGAGAYVGGVIAPGLNLMTDYLHERTALLPRVTLREPRQLIAQSTVEAICVGAVLGYRGLIREILAGLRKELGASKTKLHVLATGGQAAFVARGLPEIQAVVPGLTLEGLRIWAGTRL